MALQHALEEAGGAIQMFHPKYLHPQAYYAAVGVRKQTPDRLRALEDGLKAVPGVRSAIVDPDRWFTNEKGIDVGGAVVFADLNPRLVLGMADAAKKAGFIWEPRDHGHGAEDHDEWSEMNHAFSGVCLLFLAVIGVLQLALRPGCRPEGTRGGTGPPMLVRYGTVFVWLALFLFLFIRADRTYWPLGRIPWWDGFREWDTFQHRIGIGMILLLAVGDFLRVRSSWKLNPALGRWGMLGLGVAGSGMLFAHLHSSIDPAHYRLVLRMNAQHLGMASSALLFSLSKFTWDTWQMPRRGGQYLWLACLGVLGLFLTLYVE